MQFMTRGITIHQETSSGRLQNHSIVWVSVLTRARTHPQTKRSHPQIQFLSVLVFQKKSDTTGNLRCPSPGKLEDSATVHMQEDRKGNGYFIGSTVNYFCFYRILNQHILFYLSLVILNCKCLHFPHCQKSFRCITIINLPQSNLHTGANESRTLFSSLHSGMGYACTCPSCSVKMKKTERHYFCVEDQVAGIRGNKSFLLRL